MPARLNFRTEPGADIHGLVQTQGLVCVPMIKLGQPGAPDDQEGIDADLVRGQIQGFLQGFFPAAFVFTGQARQKLQHQAQPRVPDPAGRLDHPAGGMTAPAGQKDRIVQGLGPDFHHLDPLPL